MNRINIFRRSLKLIARILVAGTVLSSHVLAAGTLAVNWSTDKEPVSYLPGETMTFQVQLVRDGRPLAGKTLRWVREGDDQKTATGEAQTSESQPVEISTSLATPGFIRLKITVFNEDGSPVIDPNGKPVVFEGGAGVEPLKLGSSPEPADFDAFWTSQKALLAKVPLKFTLTKIPSAQSDFLLFDVKVDCAGGRPVSGYLTRPKDAAPKSLEAQVGFMGYGVNSATPEYLAGKLVFNINAHGVENGKDPDYYAAFENGELKGYAFDKKQNAGPETCYFNGMTLRVLRALEFVKAQPEWDGKTLVARGGSQGGFQALAAAGLDNSVSQCFAYKPWCCDLSGVQLNRLKGWRPEFTSALSYYDPVNHAKRIQSEIVVLTSGLGDYICPPSSISVLYNNIKGAKQIEFIQGATHGYSPPNPKSQKLEAK